MPCASTHSQTTCLAWPWPTTSTHPLVLPSHQQHTLANNNTYPTRMAPLVARTMQHPVSTIAQISVLEVATASIVPPWDAASSHCRLRVDVDQNEDMEEDMDKDKVKSAPPRPISSLQSLSARGKPVADQTNALRDFPTQQLSQPASFSWLLRARARWPRVRMKKPQTANLSGLPSSCCQLHNN